MLSDKKEEYIQPDKTICGLCTIILTAVLSVVFFFTDSAFSADQGSAKKVEQKQQAETPKKFNVGDFIYTSTNKRDPFVPAFILKNKENKGINIPKKGYELEELKLVGILKTDKTKYAMMEDMQGKGINFKKGDFVNNNLWIVDILDDRVIMGYKIKGEVRKVEVNIPKKQEG